MKSSHSQWTNKCLVLAFSPQTLNHQNSLAGKSTWITSAILSLFFRFFFSSFSKDSVLHGRNF